MCSLYIPHAVLEVSPSAQACAAGQLAGGPPVGRPQTAVACRSGVFRCNTGNLHIRLDHQMVGSPVLPFRWRLSMKLDAMLYRLHSHLEQEKEEKEKKRKERLPGDDSLAISIMRCQKT